MYLLPKILARLPDLDKTALTYLVAVLKISHEVIRDNLFATVSQALETASAEVLLHCWEFLKREGRTPPHKPWQKWIDDFLAQHKDLSESLILDLKSCREDVTYNSNQLFWWACQDGHVDLAEMLLEVPGANLTKEPVGHLSTLCRQNKELKKLKPGETYRIRTFKEFSSLGSFLDYHLSQGTYGSW